MNQEKIGDFSFPFRNFHLIFVFYFIDIANLGLSRVLKTIIVLLV